eukprot:TRINITY_DN5638_c1_g1_i1.p1 TRINITY_DN5638_c1_g1~~TRINITY_DN5638_c1_g1_i1.p1  ORF type:complete len:334 (-),score=40.75 TRINITY_DN5638_c1_g1_i1:566-1567(-)
MLDTQAAITLSSPNNHGNHSRRVQVEDNNVLAQVSIVHTLRAHSAENRAIWDQEPDLVSETGSRPTTASSGLQSTRASLHTSTSTLEGTMETDDSSGDMPSMDIDNQASFHHMCRDGDIEGVLELLRGDADSPGRPDVNCDHNLPLYLAARHGHTEIVRILLDTEDIVWSQGWNKAFVIACRNGHLGVVEILLADGRPDPTCEDHGALRWACDVPHFPIIQALVQDRRVDPGHNQNEFLCTAADRGLTMVALALCDEGRVDPSARDNYCIQSAAAHGYFDFFMMLYHMPCVDPSANNNAALKLAKENGRDMIVSMLEAHPRVQQVMRSQMATS